MTPSNASSEPMASAITRPAVQREREPAISDEGELIGLLWVAHRNLVVHSGSGSLT
jgi:hypothetical protein